MDEGFFQKNRSVSPRESVSPGDTLRFYPNLAGPWNVLFSAAQASLIAAWAAVKRIIATARDTQSTTINRPFHLLQTCFYTFLTFLYFSLV